MTDSGTLFWLILAALILINTSLFVIVSLIITEDRKKKGLKVKERSTPKKKAKQECLHFFGYLAEYRRNQPIPDECFGCTMAMDCIQAKKRVDEDTKECRLEVEESPLL